MAPDIKLAMSEAMFLRQSMFAIELGQAIGHDVSLKGMELYVDSFKRSPGIPNDVVAHFLVEHMLMMHANATKFFRRAAGADDARAALLTKLALQINGEFLRTAASLKTLWPATTLAAAAPAAAAVRPAPLPPPTPSQARRADNDNGAPGRDPGDVHADGASRPPGASVKHGGEGT